MPFCVKCGNQLRVGAKFCDNCGSAICGSGNNKRKEEYAGEIRKCPKCGETIKSFTLNCPLCGYEIRKANTTSAIKDLAVKLEKTNSKEQKIELIRDFYIPNTKEDIFEFFMVADSIIKDGDDDYARVWRLKLFQAYEKAKITFVNTSELQYLEKIYKEAINRHKKQSVIKAVKASFRFVINIIASFFKGVKTIIIAIICAIAESKTLQSVLISAIGVALMIIGFFKGEESGDSDSKYYYLALIGMFILISGSGSFITRNDKDR